jgi:hypothetical protein
MSVILPTKPAQVNIHLLPKDAEMISYSVSDLLKISAWMPDRFQTIEQTTELSNDDFYNRHCDGCHRNSCTFFDQYYDEEAEEIDWEHPDLHEHCNVYDEGYHGQHCPEGYVNDTEVVNFDVANMVFEISLNHIGPHPRFEYKKDSAYLQKFKLNEDTLETKEFESSCLLMAANVFGSEDYPEGVCWGYNERPTSLRDMVLKYFGTPFNNDLVTIGAFQENCYQIRMDNYYYSHNNEKYFSGQADALMLIDAEANIQAFYTMLMAGFKSLPEAPHVMMIPLYDHEFEMNGKLYCGYKTSEDAVGKSWFISPETESLGLLVGQL